MEFDLRRYWGASLTDVSAGRITWRQLGDFIDHLPRDSAVARALYGEAASWTAEAHILAALWDAYAKVHTPKGRSAPTFPRPRIPD